MANCVPFGPVGSAACCELTKYVDWPIFQTGEGCGSTKKVLEGCSPFSAFATDDSNANPLPNAAQLAQVTDSGNFTNGWPSAVAGGLAIPDPKYRTTDTIYGVRYYANYYRVGATTTTLFEVRCGVPLGPSHHKLYRVSNLKDDGFMIKFPLRYIVKDGTTTITDTTIQDGFRVYHFGIVYTRRLTCYFSPGSPTVISNPNDVGWIAGDAAGSGMQLVYPFAMYFKFPFGMCAFTTSGDQNTYIHTKVGVGSYVGLPPTPFNVGAYCGVRFYYKENPNSIPWPTRVQESQKRWEWTGFANDQWIGRFYNTNAFPVGTHDRPTINGTTIQGNKTSFQTIEGSASGGTPVNLPWDGTTPW